MSSGWFSILRRGKGVGALAALVAASVAVILIVPRSPAPEPPGVILPPVIPVVKESMPVEEPAGGDPGGPLAPLPELEPLTGPAPGMEMGGPAAPFPEDPESQIEETEPSLVPSLLAEKNPAPVPAEPVPEPPPTEIPSPEETVEEDPTLVVESDAAPLPEPVDDPSQLPTPQELKAAEELPPSQRPRLRDSLLSALNSFLRIVAADGQFQIKLGGRVYSDAAVMAADPELSRLVGDFDNDWEFRSVQLGLIGVAWFVEFKAVWDFAGAGVSFDDPDLKDAWVGVRGLPLLDRVRVGRMREPFGLEPATGANALTFMERSLPNVLTPARNTGVLAFGSLLEDRLMMSAGLFGHTESTDRVGSFGTNVTVRICGTPWFEEKGKKLLHLGVSGSLRNSLNDSVGIGTRPEAHLASNIVATDEFEPDHVQLLGFEAALVNGPFSLQGEVVRYSAAASSSGDAVFWGAYGQTSWMITGEQRRYLKGLFLRPMVERLAFDEGAGLGGAIELAARVSCLDLDGGGMEGGRVIDGTLGLNWYLGMHSRLMVNLVHTRRRGVGSANILQFRLQIDF
jgi:phosphate-selective porin OprO and OprP